MRGGTAVPARRFAPTPCFSASTGDAHIRLPPSPLYLRASPPFPPDSPIFLHYFSFLAVPHPAPRRPAPPPPAAAPLPATSPETPPSTPGKGAYGVVCSAKDTATGEKVAIKKIANAFDNVVDATRTLREIQLLRHLRHENIIRVRDVAKPSKREGFTDVYVVYELMDTDLHQIIRSPQPLSEDHVQYFLWQLLRRATGDPGDLSGGPDVRGSVRRPVGPSGPPSVGSTRPTAPSAPRVVLTVPLPLRPAQRPQVHPQRQHPPPRPEALQPPAERVVRSEDLRFRSVPHRRVRRPVHD